MGSFKIGFIPLWLVLISATTLIQCCLAQLTLHGFEIMQGNPLTMTVASFITIYFLVVV